MVFCVVAPCNVMVGYQCFREFNPKDGGSTVLQNVGIYPPHYTVQQLRKPHIIFSLL
jgi:hypothetical protein